LRLTAELMMRVPSSLARQFAIPSEVLREASRNPQHRAATLAAFSEAREVCADLGLTTRAPAPLWRSLGAA
jgi:hypothetical protein